MRPRPGSTLPRRSDDRSVDRAWLRSPDLPFHAIARLPSGRTGPCIAGRGGAPMHVDRRLLGWGLFFILVGGIPLAVRTNVISAALVGQWANLWPLLLIAWGIGLLLRGTPIEWIGGALTAITFGVMGGGLLATGASGLPFATGCSGSGTTTAFPSRTGDLVE